jgi:electron transfer flavoprotein beta subunit
MPIAEKAIETYGLDIRPRLEVLRVVEPAHRKAGVKLKSVAELIDKLRNEAGVL